MRAKGSYQATHRSRGRFSASAAFPRLLNNLLEVVCGPLSIVRAGFDVVDACNVCYESTLNDCFMSGKQPEYLGL